MKFLDTYRHAPNVPHLQGTETAHYIVIKDLERTRPTRRRYAKKQTVRALWRVQCKHCQEHFDVTTMQIQQDRIGSCPKCGVSYRARPRKADLLGQTFGRGTVIKALPPDEITEYARWRLRCSCADQTLYDASSDDLRRGRKKSCGCLRREATAERNRNRAIARAS
jgi:hypothetical protein